MIALALIASIVPGYLLGKAIILTGRRAGINGFSTYR